MPNNTRYKYNGTDLGFAIFMTSLVAIAIVCGSHLYQNQKARKSFYDLDKGVRDALLEDFTERGWLCDKKGHEWVMGKRTATLPIDHYLLNIPTERRCARCNKVETFTAEWK